MKNIQKLLLSAKKILKENDGISLMEETVSLILLVMVIGILYTLIFRGFVLYNEVKTTINARNVSEIIMDKVSGEISGAQPGGIASQFNMIVENGDSGNANECIGFYTRTNSQVYIREDAGRLVEHYRPVSVNDGHDIIPASDWKFDDKMYMGYFISSLKFEIVRSGGKKTNVIKVSLTVENEKSGYSNSTEKYVECYNFSSSDVKDRLSDGGVYSD